MLPGRGRILRPHEQDLAKVVESHSTLGLQDWRGRMQLRILEGVVDCNSGSSLVLGIFPDEYCRVKLIRAAYLIRTLCSVVLWFDHLGRRMRYGS
jgi:hypothetical protein